MTADHQKRTAVLHLLASAGPQTRADVQRILRMEYGATVRHLTALERGARIFYDPFTDTYTITESGRMRINRKKNTQNSAPGAVHIDRSGLGHAAPGADTNVIRMDDTIDQMTVLTHGAAYFAKEVVAGEVDLYERLAAALADGMEPPQLLEVPRRNRIATVVAALDQWDDTTGGPCSYCGTIKSQPGYVARGWLDNDDTAAFAKRADGTTACRWCNEFLIGRSADQLRKAVFNAVTGSIGFAEVIAQAAGRQYIPFAHEVPGGVARSVVPWAHLTPAMREAMCTAAQLRTHPSRFVRTEGQRDRVRMNGIETPIHPPQPKRTVVPPTVAPSDGTSYREQIRAAEKRHAAERISFLAANPRIVDGEGATPMKDGGPFTSSWPAADAWTALLQKHRDELVAIDKRHPTRSDGRPRPTRPSLGQASAAGLR